jgi:DNA-binding NarL/FixJ family response regulator
MPTFLVVDDSAMDRKLAGSALAKLDESDVCYFCNGAVALEQLSLLRPDLIVSDLQMPEMDGWQLLDEVQRTHPRLPVVLMTSDGSEDLVIRAMESGAAGFVPKRRLTQDLGGTVERVLAKAIRQRLSSRLLRRIRQQEMTFVLENDASLLLALATQLRETVQAHWLCDEVQILRIGMAIEEALINAAYHGNLELSSSLRNQDDNLYWQLAHERARQSPFAQRRVTVQFHCGPRFMSCTIRDEGSGFDPGSLPDPFSEESLSKPSGRGLTLIRSFMDEVRFNDRGNEISLFKRRPPQPGRVLDSDDLVFASR